ncbi:aminopeptidase [Treponema pectinovorum]|uniref:aminopeptidase n=1 Tax=Treponema pectinovorum TaxID=164 RepID=UPI003D8F9705
MADLIKSYKEFLNKGKTERECVVQLIDWAEKNGYKNVESVKKISVGDKVYFQKMNKAIALFQFGSFPLENGMNILGAHIDSPRLDVKQNPLYEKDFLVYLNTHYYGGIKKYQWVTLPLAIHGVICTKDSRTIDVKIGEEDDEPVFVISDILPHLAQKQMKELASDFIPGENLDLICGSESPSKENEKENAKKAILKILKDKYGIEEDDFASSELEVVPAGKARDLGLDKSMVLAYGQDDRACAFTSARAMLDSVVKNRTLCCLCVDKEEIGSVGATGMASHFFENAVAEIIARSQDAYSDLCLRRCLANSYMLSSDVNAAYDPMNAELFDKNNSSFLGGGIVFNKYTGSRGKSGASDANPEFIAKLRRVLDENKVKYQMAELGKVDQGGGGTIAYLAAKYGMEVLDAGVSVLSMHSPWEITNKFDLEQAYNAYKAFFTL